MVCVTIKIRQGVFFLFAKSKSTLKPKKKKVSFSDIVELIPDEPPMKDIKV